MNGIPSPSEIDPRPLLRVSHLRKDFPLRNRGIMKQTAGWTRAVDDVSFDLQPGETLGLVGESGSGKTTVARCILRAMAPTSGEILFNLGGRLADVHRLAGCELAALRRKMQMIFQDPFSSLNPRMTVRQIVGEPLLIHRLAQGSELQDRVAEILRKVGLKPEEGALYPHAFSGGERQRIGIARALILRPSLVVADEAVSALDVSVAAQVLNLLQDLQAEFGLTYLFVAHNLDIVRHFCDRVAVMQGGRLVEVAETEELFTAPRHPYTRALLSFIPSMDPEVRAKIR